MKRSNLKQDRLVVAILRRQKLKNTFRALAMVTIIVSIVTAEITQAGPKLTIPEPAFDFGYVPQHSSVSHKFWLISTGDDTLRIVKITTGCGCTKAPLKTDRLAAGDSTALEVIFSTQSYRNRIAKSPTIQTNEGPLIKNIRIESNVVSRPDSTYPLIMNPYKLELSQNSEKVIDKMEFTIQNVSDTDLEIEIVSEDRDFLEIDIPKSIGAGMSGKGKVKLKKSVVGKSFEKSFTIEVNDQAKSRFTIPVKRTISLFGSQNSSTK